MRGFVPPDPQTSVSISHYAVIHAPHRKRKRFPAGMVHIVNSAEDALREAAGQHDHHAAMVLGPSKSSEGQFLYYLIEWIDNPAEHS